MILVSKNNLKFNKYGTSSPSHLNPSEALVYESDTTFSSVDYAGFLSSIIHQSKGISKFFQDKLSTVQNIKCSLGGKYTNANLYAPDAETLSGYNRICYIKGMDEAIIKIYPYFGSRGAKYSGYYPVLLSKAKQSGKFLIQGDGFIIPRKSADEFIRILNELSDDILKGKFILLKNQNQYDEIKIEGKYYYYDSVQWDYSENHAALLNQEKEAFDLKNNLENILKYLFCRDKVVIDNTSIDIDSIKYGDLDDKLDLNIFEGISILYGNLHSLSKMASELSYVLENYDEGLYDVIYEKITTDYFDNIFGLVDEVAGVIDVLHPNISFKFTQIYKRIEAITMSKELTELSAFNKEEFINTRFRKNELEGVYDADDIDNNFEEAESEAEDLWQDLCIAAERYLRELLDNMNLIG